MGNKEKLTQEEFIAKVDYIFSNSFNHTQHAYIDIVEDLVAGTLLSQIMYWFSLDKDKKSKIRIFKDGKYWLAKSREDWFEEIRISPKQYDTAIKKLKGKGLVETKLYKFNAVPTTHIRPIFSEINSRISEWKNKIGLEILNEIESDIPISGNPDLPIGEKGNNQSVNMEVDQMENSLTEITTENTTDTNSKANSFFTKKVRERKRTVNQDELLNRIHNVVSDLNTDILSDDLAENVEQCLTYFVEQYAEVFGRKHPVIQERTLYDLIADLIEDTYEDRGEFETHFYPLVSDDPEDNSYESVIDLYFETEFKENIDYSIVHFSQKNVLTKFMGHDTSHEWFRNES